MSEIKDIAIYGIGGLGRQTACLLRRINAQQRQWNLIGFFVDDVEPGTQTEYGPVLGDMSALNAWDKPLAVVFAIANPAGVKRLVAAVENPHIYFPNIIAPDVIFLDSDNTTLGWGNIISSLCLISCNVKLGNFNILNHYITVGHDTEAGDFNAIMPGCRLGGNLSIKDGNFIGANAVILEKLSIGNDNKVGAGAVVIKSIGDRTVSVGVPAKVIKAWDE